MSEGTDPQPEPPLLTADEPSPFYVVNPVSEIPLLLVCDHASCRFPNALGDLGLDPFARRCHLAIDIGAGDHAADGGRDRPHGERGPERRPAR